LRLDHLHAVLVPHALELEPRADGPVPARYDVPLALVLLQRGAVVSVDVRADGDDRGARVGAANRVAEPAHLRRAEVPAERVDERDDGRRPAERAKGNGLPVLVA